MCIIRYELVFLKGRTINFQRLTIWRLTATYRTVNLQMLHFLFIQQIYVLDILHMLRTLRFFLFKMSFIS